MKERKSSGVMNKNKKQIPQGSKSDNLTQISPTEGTGSSGSIRQKSTQHPSKSSLPIQIQRPEQGKSC
jgi:hypothetical protein